MSVNATKWVWDLRGLPHTQKIVLLCIADHANKDGNNAFPGLRRLSDECGMGRRAVINNVQRLVDRGLLERIRPDERDGGPPSNLYSLPIRDGGELNAPPSVHQNHQGVPLNQEGVHLKSESGDADAPEPSINHQRTVREGPRKRGSNFPPQDFKPSNQDIKWFKTQGLTIDMRRETVKFRTYEYRRPIKDFSRAWRNFMLKGQDFAERQHGR